MSSNKPKKNKPPSLMPGDPLKYANYCMVCGKEILKLTAYLVDTEEPVTAEIVDEPVEEKETREAGRDVPPVSQQMVNNNPTFFNISISGGNNNFYQHVDKRK